MRAAVITGTHSVQVDDVADAALPGADGAVVTVQKSAICGSDLHFYDGDMGVGPDGLRIGHEAVGIVAEVGNEVRTVKVGDRVVIASVAGCGHCVGCALGDPVQCRNGGPKVFGAGQLGGAQAEALAVPGADFQLRKLAGELSEISDEAALLLTDNLPTGWIGARNANFVPGATVAVIGLGAVGLCAVRSALMLGAGRVLAVDPVAGRRAIAESFGAQGVDPNAEGGTVAALLEATSGLGVDSVIEAIALDATLDAALASVRPGGTLSIIGVHALTPYPFPVLMSLFRNLTIRTTTAPIQQTWRELLPLVASGRIATDGIFTHSFPLEKAADAYAAVAARTGDCIKTVFEVS
jgi:2-desacetyl-2-hydroxyethyl bacteriochlorophyllide A dehydrogenase